MVTIDELETRVGEELGVSTWRTVAQADIDAFADVTGDHQFIHVDAARALPWDRCFSGSGIMMT